MIININDSIKVKLTEAGVKILAHRDDELIKQWPRLSRCLKPQQPDSSGFYNFTFWDFMNLFGEHMCIANLEIPFTEIHVDKPLDPRPKEVPAPDLVKGFGA